MSVEIGFLTTFATSVLSVLGKKLAKATLSEIKKYIDVEANFAELTNEIYKIQSNLENVDDKHLNRTTFKTWVLKLTMLCYLVDDIIDDINLEMMKLNKQYPSSVLHKTLWFGRFHLWGNDNGYAERRDRVISSSLRKWNLPHKIAVMLKCVQKINRDVYEVVAHTKAKDCEQQSSKKRPASFYHSRLPRGRKSEKQEIIEKLLQAQNGGGVTIVGMAGLGKSVVAHSIINDDNIKQRFDVILWATSASDWKLYDDISIKQIEQQSSLSSSSSPSSTCRLLLLLDDLRITRIREWKGLRAALAEKLQREPTVIIVTSRDPAVAIYTETTLHHLRLLSIQDCETIIKTNLSSVQNSYHICLLKSKVNCIAQKCEGLPLVADLIGQYLKTEYRVGAKKFKEAIEILERLNLWEQRVFRREILPELGFDKSLYEVLAYFALFPSEYYFNKKDMSLLWMSEGCFRAVEEWMDTSEIDHFDSLVARSMLINTTRSSPRGSEAPSTYQMHKFVQKFSQTIACSTYFQLDEARLSSFIQGDIPSSYIRHFSSCCRKLEENCLSLIEKNHDKLRTFLLLPEYEISIQAISPSLFKRLKYLRVLCLRGSDITELPHTLSNMKHLRYLDVSYTYIMRLPIALCNLIALQVLKLKSCLKLVRLPENFESLTNLIHLELDMPRLNSTPANLGRLTKLQTLPVFIVEKSSGHHVSELKNMNSLCDSIKITKLENVASKSEAEEAMLSRKPNIKKLELEWIENFNQDSSLAEDVLTGLKPSDKLQELRVSNYQGITFPDWIVNTLINVATISLYNCPNCTVFPPFGLLPLLRKLKIERMSKIKTVQGSNSNNRADQHGEYPTLEHLEISNMESLVEWDILVPENMPYLRVLRVTNCPELLTMSMIGHPSLRRPDISGCPKLNGHQE